MLTDFFQLLQPGPEMGFIGWLFINSDVSSNKCNAGLLYQELDIYGRAQDLTAPLLIGRNFELGLV